MENKFRTQFDRLVVSHETTQPSRTMQEFKEECDINVILEKINSGIDITPSSIARGRARRQPQYGDFSTFGDYQTMQEQVNQAQANFDALPSKIRERFGYSPAALIRFVSDPNNRAEAESLGLVVPPKKESAVVSPVSGTSVVDNQTEGVKDNSSL